MQYETSVKWTSRKSDGIERQNSTFTEAHLATYADRIHFSSLPLIEIIEKHCLVPDAAKSKIVVLICHSETDAFGKVISKWLNNSTSILSLLSNPIFIVNWYNVTTETARYELMESLANVVNDEHYILSTLQSGESKIYLLVPYYDIIVSQCYIDESMNEDDTVTMLRYIKDLFDDIKKLRLREQIKNDTPITCDVFQQLMMCRLSDRRYDTFFANEHQELKDKIGFAYFGAPLYINGTYSSEQNEMIIKAYKAIIFQSEKYAMDKGVVVISFIYVCVLNCKIEIHPQTRKLVSYISKVDFKTRPCFVLRKCYEDPFRFTPFRPYCRIVIDSTLRVYQSWQGFLDENTFPKCVLCVPTDGRYQCDDKGDVKLEYYYPPSCGITQQVLRATDTTVAVASTASRALLIAAATIPAVALAPFVLIGAGTVCVASGLYSIGRNVHQIVDKSLHDEDMSFMDPQARAAYIGIIAGSLGFVGFGANVIVAHLANNGAQIGKGAILTVNVLNKANLAAGGIALTNSVCDVAHSCIKKKQRPSSLMFLQLGASTLFFTNAVYNYKIASNFIAKVEKNNAIRDCINSLQTKPVSSQIGESLATLKKPPTVNETVQLILDNQERFSEVGVEYIKGNIVFNGQAMNITKFTEILNTVDATPYANASITKPSLNITLSELSAVALKVIPAFSSAKHVEEAALNLLQLFAPDAQRKLLDLINKIFTSRMCRPIFPFWIRLGNELSTSLKNHGINVEIVSQIINCLVSKAETTLNDDFGSFWGTRYVQVVIINYFLCGRSITSELVQDCIQYLNMYAAKKVTKCIKASVEEEKIRCLKNRSRRICCPTCNGQFHLNK